MKKLTEQEADVCGIHTLHHEMENGEKRFRLIADTGSSYILTQSCEKSLWQKSHIHYKKKEYYIVEKGSLLIALWDGDKLEMKKLAENDSLLIPEGIAHNVLASENAVFHTVKFGTQEEDWNACPELDAILAI